MSQMRARLFNFPVAVALIAGAAIIGGSSLYATARSENLAAPAPASVALVDIVKLIQSMHELQERGVEFERKATDLSNKIKETEAEIEKIKGDLDVKIDKKDYKTRSEALARLAELNALREARVRSSQAIVDILKGDINHDMYEKATAAIADFATREGFDLVLFDDRAAITLPPLGRSFQDLQPIVATKRILFARPGLDVTDRLINIVNTAYDTQHPPAPVVPGAAPTTPAPTAPTTPTTPAPGAPAAAPGAPRH